MIGKFLTSRLDVMLRQQLDDGSGRPVDLSQPTGEPALVPGDSVSWEVFGNPVTLLIGGITAVLLELAEPKVRSGVWDHTSFRTDPLKRMRRTGIAAEGAMQLEETIGDLSDQMLAAAAELKFELAARLRDEVQDLKKELRAMERAGHA